MLNDNWFYTYRLEVKEGCLIIEDKQGRSKQIEFNHKYDTNERFLIEVESGYTSVGYQAIAKTDYNKACEDLLFLERAFNLCNPNNTIDLHVIEAVCHLEVNEAILYIEYVLDAILNYPKLAILTKCGLSQRQLGSFIGTNYTYARARDYNLNGNNPSELLNISKQVFNIIRKYEFQYSEWYNLRKIIDSIQDINLIELFVAEDPYNKRPVVYPTMHEVRELVDLNESDRLDNETVKYITKRLAKQRATVNEYINYLEGRYKIEDLDVDLLDQFPIRPRNLAERHKLMVEMIEESQNKEGTIKIERVKESFRYLEGSILGYEFTLPETAKELILEGDNLNHCVGGYRLSISEQKIIVFMRKDPSVSLVTIELVKRDKGYKLAQARGFNNRALDENEYKAIEAWAKKNNIILE